MKTTPFPSVESRSIRVVLAGNPNAGKSTLFNALTGMRQHVGNWPGKTVEKKTGVYNRDWLSLAITDLPGTYSLSAFSLEEIIARDFILDELPEVIVAVADASNLERNLYLVVQLLELERPLVLALNMMDIAVRQGWSYDIGALSRGLAAPVLQMTARKAEGLDALVDTIEDLSANQTNSFEMTYGHDIDTEIACLAERIEEVLKQKIVYPARWLAIKLLEGDADVVSRIQSIPGGLTVLTTAELARARLEALFAEDIETLMADRRYRWIHELVTRCVERSPGDIATPSDRIDRVATHRWLGIPLFMLAMWIVFKITTDISAPWVDWITGVITGPISRWAVALLNTFGLGESWVASLVVDGLLAGVGVVMAFIPVLLALYFALAVLEDTGYMARGAFVMDRFMNRLGLHGRSFLPLMVGFGCSVPAIYATRTLTNQRDRILTGLLVPFMSCGARLPVYILFSAIFFPRNASLVILGLYLLGIVVALGIGLLLQRTWLPSEVASGLVMELPPYRLPHARSIWYHMWQRTRSFLQHAASLILFTAMIIWLMMAIPIGGRGTFANTPVEESAFGRLSTIVAPVLRPLGFGSWQASGALISGLVAKEVVISTLAQSYRIDDQPAATGPAPTFFEDLAEIGASFAAAVGDTLRAIPSLIGINLSGEEEEQPSAGVSAALQASFEVSSGGHAALAGLAFMVFVLLYTPCMAAIAAERQELGTRWMWLSVGGQLLLAWLVAFVIFRGGLLLGVG